MRKQGILYPAGVLTGAGRTNGGGEASGSGQFRVGGWVWRGRYKKTRVKLRSGYCVKYVCPVSL